MKTKFVLERHGKGDNEYVGHVRFGKQVVLLLQEGAVLNAFFAPAIVEMLNNFPNTPALKKLKKKWVAKFK